MTTPLTTPTFWPEYLKTGGAAPEGIPRVCVYIDDVLVTGTTEQEHLPNLTEVLRCGNAIEKGQVSVSGTNLLYDFCVFDMSLSWAVFLHLIICHFYSVSFYRCALFMMFGGLAGLCHGRLHSCTDLQWSCTSII